MRFVAVDVETANADMASICAIGAATFQGGKLRGEFYELVDLEDDFDLLNVSIHGISERMVAGKPTFAALFGTLCGLLQDAIVVTHTHFDRVALHQAAQRCGIEAPVCRWLDTAKLARRVWL